MSSTVETEIITRQDILDMMSKKENLEQQLQSSFHILETHGVGMDESLVDNQDFPRNDIDICQIRLLRNSVIRSRNDLKTLMDRIEKSLNIYFTQSNHNEHDSGLSGMISEIPDH